MGSHTGGSSSWGALQVGPTCFMQSPIVGSCFLVNRDRVCELLFIGGYL